VDGSFARALARLQRAAGVKRITIKGMRHTFATRALRSGVALATLQKWLGHRSITMTMRYAHVTEELHAVDAAKFPNLTDNGLTTTTRGAAMGRAPSH
jgi:integrase